MCEFSLKDFKTPELVQMLAALVTADSRNAALPVHQPHAALCFVPVLAAWPAGFEGVNLARGEKIGKNFIHTAPGNLAMNTDRCQSSYRKWRK